MNAARALHAALWSLIAFAAVYLLQGALHLPAVLYHPVTRAISAGPIPSGLQMRYYSDLGFASLAGLGAALLRLRLRERPFEPLVLAATALSLVGLDVAFYFSRVLASR